MNTPHLYVKKKATNGKEKKKQGKKA